MSQEHEDLGLGSGDVPHIVPGATGAARPG